MAKKTLQINVDVNCPYCKGQRRHSGSPAARKTCKQLGPINKSAPTTK